MDLKSASSLIAKLKKSELVTKVSPWMKDVFKGEKCDVRYVGIKVNEDWQGALTDKDNLMLKFVVNSKVGIVQFLLANKPPFVFITQTNFSKDSKWEHLLGEFKRRLLKDYQDFQKHEVKMGNWYELIKGERK